MSTSLYAHINNIKQVLAKLHKANLNIHINKCKFFAKEILYLGHILTAEGVKPNTTIIDKILKLELVNL